MSSRLATDGPAPLRYWLLILNIELLCYNHCHFIQYSTVHRKKSQDYILPNIMENVTNNLMQ